MPGIGLDTRLKQDSHLLGWLGSTDLLLMRNALFPWFVLVPETDEIEFYKLDSRIQMQLLTQINLISEFIESNFQIDKLNIGLIGNVVPQLHVHVVGRRREDICWPGVVWGVKESIPYAAGQVEKIVTQLLLLPHAAFRANPERV
ncbi:MAG: HIT domain-containing protein [Gammaproteobacteria bacterium]|nr:HIT domain-containing protein [Gammaproteobacteria bacterium]HXK57102.1 HIT family protein [Gammaproteobacteria bacterium]